MMFRCSNLRALLVGAALVSFALPASASMLFGDDDDDFDVLGLPGQVVTGTLGMIAIGGDDNDGEAQCARRFRSYNPATGTYRTYQGQEVMCPYLRS